MYPYNFFIMSETFQNLMIDMKHEIDKKKKKTKNVKILIAAKSWPENINPAHGKVTGRTYSSTNIIRF